MGKAYGFLSLFAVPMLYIGNTVHGSEVLWQDDFSTDRSMEYTVLPVISPGAGPIEHRVVFGFDFSAERVSEVGTRRPSAPIPAAPGSGDTSALLLEVNYSSRVFQGISVFPTAVVPPETDFTVEASVFFRIPGSPDGQFTGGTGSTQFYMLGINHAAPAPQPPSILVYDANVYGDGYVWAASGDGGWATDYALARGSNPHTKTVVLWGDDFYDHFASDPSRVDNGVDAEEPGAPFGGIYTSDRFPYPKGKGGSCGDAWTRVRIEHLHSSCMTRVFLDGQLAATYTDSSRLYDEGGHISVSLYDPSNSSAKKDNRCYLLVDDLLIVRGVKGGAVK